MAQILDRLIDAIEGEDSEGFGRLFSEDAVLHEPLFPEPARGRAEIVAGEMSLFNAFSDIDVKVRSVRDLGSVVVAEVVLTARNDGPLDLGGEQIRATGVRVEVPMVWVLELDEDGLIVAERDYFDTATIMTQLGLT